MKEKVLLVSGSRNIIDSRIVFNCLDEIFSQHEFDTILEGGAKGVDCLAKLYGICYNMNVITKTPDWKLGKSAGILRNEEMVQECDKGIAIWDGKSKGTEHCIKELKKANKLLKVFTIK